MDGGAWWAAVHGIAMSWTRLRDFTFTFHFHALEKEMATHSSVLAWRIPGTAEPGGLPSMGSHRVRHDWRDLTAAAAAALSVWFGAGYLTAVTFNFLLFSEVFLVHSYVSFNLSNLSLSINIHAEISLIFPSLYIFLNRLLLLLLSRFSHVQLCVTS